MNASSLTQSRLVSSLCALAALASFASPAAAQVLLEENFTFTGPLTSNGWTAVSGGGSNAISAAAPGLTYPNLPSSGVGNAASLTTSGEDDRKSFSPTNTIGDVYTSFLVNVSAAQTAGDYFTMVGTGNSFFSRIFAKSSGSGFQLGIQKGSTAPVSYYTNDLQLNTTYLVVTKLTRASGVGVASLWVNPVLGGVESAPQAQNNAGADAGNIDSVYLRQGSAGNAPTLRVGSILAGTTWASVTPTSAAGGPTIVSFSPGGGPAGTIVTISGTDFVGATSVTFNGLAAASFTVDSAAQITATVPAGATSGPIAVTTPSGFTASQSGFVVPTATVTLPVQINEGSQAVGRVTLTSAAGTDVLVTLTSSSPSDLVVDSPVTVFEGTTFSDFIIDAPLDGSVDSDVVVTVTPSTSGYTGVAGSTTVKNVDLPAAPFVVGGYSQDFTGFTGSATLPLGWSLTALNQAYSAWETTTSGAKFNSATVNVFGYKHTGSTRIAQQILTLSNQTGETIRDLTVSYFGRAFTSVGDARDPSYTVTVNGQVVTQLAYSTADGDNVQRTTSLSGLSIEPNQVFQIVWSSDGDNSPGSNTRKQIGVSNVSVSVGSVVAPPTVASLAVPLGEVTTASAAVSANVTADGGSSITVRGFVYAPTSVDPDPVIGESGVVNVVDPLAELGAMSTTLNGLTQSTQYSVRAYAANAAGTTYTVTQTFTTLGPPLDFSGSYAEAFNNFTAVTSPSLASGIVKAGWTSVSSTAVQSYIGAWTSGASSGGFYGGVSDPGVLGYQHTTGTGTNTVTLRMVNNTGAPLTQLYVRYLGRVEALASTRYPAWSVSVAGAEVPNLAYTTEAGVDEVKSTLVTGLDVAVGAEFSVVWVSSRDTGQISGSSRRIGLANVVVSTSAIPDPTINVSGSLSAFSATEGTASVSQSFNASGVGLNGNIAVTAPTNYEVSLDNTTFAPSVTLAASNGTVSSTPVYVRIAATAPVGNPAGEVSLTSSGATTQNIAVTGTVSGGGSAYDTWASGFGLDPATTGAPTADPDGDSFSNAQEYAFGTNPTQGTGSLLSTTASGGNLVVTWLQRSDVTYNVQSTANLATTAFANDGTVNVVDGSSSPTPPAGYTRKQITVAASGQKFYRVTGTVPSP